MNEWNAILHRLYEKDCSALAPQYFSLVCELLFPFGCTPSSASKWNGSSHKLGYCGPAWRSAARLLSHWILLAFEKIESSGFLGNFYSDILLLYVFISNVMLQQFKGGWKKQTKPEPWKTRSYWLKNQNMFKTTKSLTGLAITWESHCLWDYFGLL